MSISERAINGSRLSPAEMPEKERPISEEFRIAAKEWVEQDKAARLLDEMKSVTLAQMKTNLMAERGDMPDAKAERLCKSHPDWEAYIKAMVEAKAAANLARVKMQWIEMRYGEWQSADANARKERHMGRQAV
jgi:hypothetical protein